MHLQDEKYESPLLLEKFNSRNCRAFGEVYLLYADELTLFARKFYSMTDVAPEDAVHDAFISVWKSKRVIFDSLEHIKSYLYVTIKNQFRNFVKHNDKIDDYTKNIRVDPNFYISQIVESETLSIINRAIDLLPTECAKVFRMHMDGWSVRDIAETLGKSERTVFIQKQKSIAILKEKLPKNIMVLLIL